MDIRFTVIIPHGKLHLLQPRASPFGTDAPNMLLHLVKLLPVCIVAFAISRRLDRQNIIKPDGADPFVPRSISHQILAAVLHTDKNAQGNNLLRGGALPAPVDGFDLDGLFSVHRLKQSVQNLTVQRPGDIVMLEHKVFLMRIGFIQQKRTDHAAGGDLGKKVKRICTGRLSRGRTAVQQCFCGPICTDKALLGVFLQFFADGGASNVFGSSKHESRPVDFIHDAR